MTKWTEVNVYTGRPVDEDAPANFGGAGSGVDMNPTGMKKKKKLVDARTKSYKTHRARLEAARAKREAKRNGVKEEVKLDEAKFKVGDIVIPNVGPHKGRKHEVIADLKNNTYNIKPIGLLPKQNHYRLGAAKAKASEIKLVKEEVNEGTWAMPDSSKKLKGLMQVLKKPIPLGKGGDSAIDVIGNFIGDDELYDDLGDAGDKNPKGDARPLIMKAMKRLKITQKNAEVEEKTFSQKVKESISEFNVESLLAEDNVDVLRSIVKNKAMKPIKLKDGTMKVDLFTASAIIQVLDKVKPANKTKLTKMLNGKKSDFMRASEGIMKMIGKR